MWEWSKMRSRLWTIALALALFGCTAVPQSPPSLLSQAPTLTPATLQEAMAGSPLEPVVEVSLPEESQDDYATVRMAIRWPKPKGYGVAVIPLSVQSMRLALLKDGQELASQVVTRQAGADVAFASLRVKAVADVTLAVKAYDEASPDPATSVAVAEGASTPFTLVRSKFSSVQVALVPNFPPVVTAMTAPYQGEAPAPWRQYAAAGDEIFLDGENLERGPTPAVYFNTTSTELFSATPLRATEVTRLSATRLKVRVPANATTGNPLVVVDGITTESPSTLWIPQVSITAPKQSYDTVTPEDTRLVPDELGYNGTAVPKPIPGATLTLTASVSWTVNTPDAYDIYGQPPVITPSWVNEIDWSGTFTTVDRYATRFTPAMLASNQDYMGTSVRARVGSSESNVIKLIIGRVCSVFPAGCF